MKILKFSNDICAPCKVLDAQIRNLNLEGIEITSITRETHPGIFEKYNVKSIPLLIEINEQGEEIRRWRRESFLFYVKHKEILD